MSHLSVWLTNHYDVMKDFAGPVAAFSAAVSATAVTFMLGRRQVAIATAQAEVAKTQADIAERSLRTVTDRIKLDLFDRRMKVYDDLSQAVSEVESHKTVTRDHSWKFDEPERRAALLFGPEVQSYLKFIGEEIERARRIDISLQYDAGAELNEARRKNRSGAFDNIVHFHQKFPWLIAPYVQMHQKANVERGPEPTIQRFALIPDRPAAETTATAADKEPEQKKEEQA